MNNKIFPIFLSSLIGITTPILFLTTPVNAGAVRGWKSQQQNAYKVYLPAGNYAITASSKNGDADIVIGDLNWNPIKRGRSEGDNTVRVNLRSGYYIIVLVMHKCNSWLSGCDIYTEVIKNGAEIFPEFALIRDQSVGDGASDRGRTCTTVRRIHDGTLAHVNTPCP